MDISRNTRIWNHVLFVITGLVGAISAFVSDQPPTFESFYFLNILMSAVFVLWGTFGWSQVRHRDAGREFWIYFFGQAVIIFSKFIFTVFAYKEPHFSLFVLPVIFQMARISFYGLRFAWGVFLILMTTTNLLVSEQGINAVVESFLLQVFFIGAFLAAGRIVKRQSDQKNQIKKLARELEAGNKQLTEHVNQIEKIHADEIHQFQSLDAMRKQLLDSTTHDIRNPLGIIMGYAHMIESKGDELNDPELKKYADGIAYTTERIKGLVAGLLDFTQLETRQAIKKEPVSINSFLQRINQDLQMIAKQNKIDLQLALSPLDFDLNIDADQMFRVFENLVNNAMKFTPEGGNIYISVTGDGGEVIISVKDTGIGIPKEAIPHLFKPFYRIKGKGSRKTEGAGLGLAIVESIVKHHEGEIQVESQVGVGSTFKIILPL